MDKKQTLRIIQTLANGVDPTTGEVFPTDSPYQNVEIVRALFHTIQLLKAQSTSTKSTLLNSGTPWTAEEEGLLLANFNKGKSIKEISTRHQRTKSAISSRLKKMGLIEE